MKKGLRRVSHGYFSWLLFPNSRPDEEGIETCQGRRGGRSDEFQTADLMKKGLRRMVDVSQETFAVPNSRPDEEGIETGLGGP